jgi:hypothetical protein
MPPYRSVTEAARELGLHPQACRRLCNKHLTPLRVLGGTRLLTEGDLATLRAHLARRLQEGRRHASRTH